MATISASIALQDKMSPVMKPMLNGMNAMISGLEKIDKVSQNCVNTKSFAAARAEINQASAAMKKFDEEIERATRSQNKQNQVTAASGSAFSGMVGKIGGVIAAYATLQGAQKVLELSDSYSQSTSRLELINDGLQTTQQLQDRVYQSANDTRASYTATAGAVAKLAMQAGDAFSTNEEAVKFMEQINKQYVIAGTSAQGAEAATLQLTQAMASGVLRGEELNSIFENAQPIIQNIADYLEVPIGTIRDMASEGKITADVIKKAMFKSADATNRKFEAMDKTFGQVWTVFENKAERAFQGVFKDLNNLANSQELDGFLNAIAGGVAGIGDIISTVGSVFSVPEVQTLIADVGTHFGTAVTNFETAWEAFKTKVITDSPTIGSNFDGLKTSWDSFYKKITGDCDSFSWGNFGTGMANLFNLWVQVETGAAGVVFAVGSFVGSIVGFWDALFNIGSGEGPNWTGMIDSLNGYIQSIRQAAVSFLSIFTGNDRANEIIGEWFTIGGGSGEAYAGGIQRSETIMTAATQAAADSAIAPMTALPTATGLLGQQTGSGFAGGLLINQEAVGVAAQGMHDSTVNALNPLPENMANIGAGAADRLGVAMYTGIANMPTDISGVADGTMSQMDASIQAGTPAVAGSADAARIAIQQKLDPLGAFGRLIGQQTGDGTIKGLAERQSQIAAGGDAAATALKNSFKSALGINSPSTVFRDFGFYAIDGLIQGLSSTELMVFCESIVQDIKDAFANNNFDLKAGISFLGAGAEDFFKSIGVGGANLGDLVAPVAGGVTSGFGYRDAFMTDSGQMSSKYHEGIDIGAAYGTAVGAAGAGQVTFAGDAGGYGNMVRIDHGGGLETMYAHLSSILVSVGEFVTKMQTIGLVGSTGNSTGAHLHFGLYQDGAAIDPSGLFGGYASGTKFATRGLHLVGEKGPEIMSFAGGEKVLDAKKSKELVNSAGSKKSTLAGKPTFNNTVNVSLSGLEIKNDMDIDDVCRKIAEKMKREMNSRATGIYGVA